MPEGTDPNAVQDHTAPGAVPATGHEPPAATPAAEPVPTPASTAPAAQPPAAKTPWDDSLAQRFPDEAQRAAVSAYLRDTVQPYVTQTEQSSAEARELLNDFRNAPKDTFLEVASELIEAQALTPDDVKAYLDSLPSGKGPTETPSGEPAPPGVVPQRDPEVQALIDERAAEKRQAQEKEAFDTEYARVKAANPNVNEWDDTLFIPEVARLGDFDKAVESYIERYGPYLKWRAENATDEPTTPAAPEVLGTGEAAVGGTEQPVEKKYATLDEAVEDFFAEQRAVGKAIAPARPAPPVATS